MDTLGSFRTASYLLSPCLILMTSLGVSEAEIPEVNNELLQWGEAYTENKYKTAHSKQTWMMALTLPYLLRDSVENKYKELFHNNTFLPYLMRSPILTTLPTEGTVPLHPRDPKLSAALDGKLSKVLGKVQKKVKDEVATKVYTHGNFYPFTNKLGQTMDISDVESDVSHDRHDSANFAVPEQKNRHYSPKIQPRLWKGLVCARNHWEKNKTLINGISDSFDPDYDVWSEGHPFPNGDQTDGGAYDSEVSMLKRRSMCPNIIFHTLGPGEHPINNPLYMDSDYNFHDIPGFNGSYNFPNESRPSSSGESRMDPNDALQRAEYFRMMLNKTREERKILDEYTRDFREKDYCLRRKRRSADLARNPVELQNEIKGLSHVYEKKRKRRSVDKRDEQDNAGHAKYRRNVIDQVGALNGTIDNIDDFINVENDHGRANNKELSQDQEEANAGTAHSENNRENQPLDEDEPAVPTVHKPMHLTLHSEPVEQVEGKDAKRGDRPESDEFISIQANLGEADTIRKETDAPKTTLDYLNLVKPKTDRRARNDTPDSRPRCRCKQPKPNELRHDIADHMKTKGDPVGPPEISDDQEVTRNPYHHKAIKIYHELQEIMESLHLNVTTRDFPINIKQNREPNANGENDEADKFQTYEETTNQPPQKERLEPEDLNGKYFKGRQRKERIDDNTLYQMIKMQGLHNEYVKECKGRTLKKDATRDFLDGGLVVEQKTEDEVDNEVSNNFAAQGNIAVNQINDAAGFEDKPKPADLPKHTTETSKSHLNKCKYLYGQLRKKYNMHLNSSEREEKREVRQRIQFLKDIVKQKYEKLSKKTADKVKDYGIDKTEELAGFPVEWYAKNKDKVRTSTEIEDESIEEELEKELKAARMKMGDYRPKPRVKRATKVLIRRHNASYVVSYKHLNLFRRKNVKIYLNHEHMRRFDRKKRHVADKIESGFDSENEFDGDKEVSRRVENEIIGKTNSEIDGIVNRDDGNHESTLNGQNVINERDSALDRTHENELNNRCNTQGINKPIFLDINDLIIRHTDSITERDEDLHGMELNADDIIDSNYGDPNDILTEKEIDGENIDMKDTDAQNSIRVQEEKNDGNVIDNAEPKVIDAQNIAATDMDSLIDPVDLDIARPMPILLRRKRWEQPVYVTKPKGGWKKHIKQKIREIRKRLSTKWRDRIIEWTTKHKWETLPDEKDRTTVKQTKKFLNIDKIRQML